LNAVYGKFRDLGEAVKLPLLTRDIRITSMERFINGLPILFCILHDNQVDDALVGSVRSEYTPVEIATSGLYGCPERQMSVVEAGSSDALA